MAEYVIIGNGIASTGCIEGIRSLDKDSKISVDNNNTDSSAQTQTNENKQDSEKKRG